MNDAQYMIQRLSSVMSDGAMSLYVACEVQIVRRKHRFSAGL